jgi:hypothetical protein
MAALACARSRSNPASISLAARVRRRFHCRQMMTRSFRLIHCSNVSKADFTSDKR